MTDIKKVYFQKFNDELMNNENLNSHEKLIYIICKSFEQAPKGCRISNQYIMLRTGIKDSRTVTKYLDRLTMFGLLARKQINNKTNHIVFDKPTMQLYIRHNLNKRNKIKRGKLKSLNKPLLKGDVLNMKDYSYFTKVSK